MAVNLSGREIFNDTEHRAASATAAEVLHIRHFSSACVSLNFCID